MQQSEARRAGGQMSDDILDTAGFIEEFKARCAARGREVLCFFELHNGVPANVTSVTSAGDCIDIILDGESGKEQEKHRFCLVLSVVSCCLDTLKMTLQSDDGYRLHFIGDAAAR